MKTIRSMIDNDLYKFTQQQAVLDLYPGTLVAYQFINRGPQRFSTDILRAIRQQIRNMAELSLDAHEARFLASVGCFDKRYIAYLRLFNYDPGQVSTWLDDQSQLHVEIRGLWESAILWEVPLLAIISETYFDATTSLNACETRIEANHNADRLCKKGESLSGLSFADFGTRRRRSYDYHAQAVSILKSYPGFFGTSNVHLAQRFDVAPIGTMGHEFIMGVSALEGLLHANRHALRSWRNVYKRKPGIALTDTFGTTAFWRDFDHELSVLYDGVRHDSGDPGLFTERMLDHYHKLGIDPLQKEIVYSDSLTVDKCCELARRHGNKVGRQKFCIGTHLTNDVPGEPPLNIVIKLTECDGVKVVKLSDTPDKATGDNDALRIARYVFHGTPL